VCNYCRHTHLYTVAGGLPRYQDEIEKFIRRVEEEADRERMARVKAGKRAAAKGKPARKKGLLTL